MHLEEYLPVLKAEGYSMAEDVENMIGLSKEDLRKMGVTKRGWCYAARYKHSQVVCLYVQRDFYKMGMYTCTHCMT